MKGLKELNKIKIFEYTYPNIVIKPFKITADNPNKNRTVTTIGKTFNKEIKIIEKELKALEIIKNKKVDIRRFMLDSCLEHYNMNYRCEELTQEEYDLLKEILL